MQHEITIWFSVSRYRNVWLYPRGNKNARGQSLSLYLELSDCNQAPSSWMQAAGFRLTVVNHKGPALSVSGGQEFLTN